MLLGNTPVPLPPRDFGALSFVLRDTAVEVELNGGGEDMRVWLESCWVEGLDSRC